MFLSLQSSLYEPDIQHESSYGRAFWDRASWLEALPSWIRISCLTKMFKGAVLPPRGEGRLYQEHRTRLPLSICLYHDFLLSNLQNWFIHFSCSYLVTQSKICCYSNLNQPRQKPFSPLEFFLDLSQNVDKVLAYCVSWVQPPKI